MSHSIKIEYFCSFKLQTQQITVRLASVMFNMADELDKVTVQIQKKKKWNRSMNGKINDEIILH